MKYFIFKRNFDNVAEVNMRCARMCQYVTYIGVLSNQEIIGKFNKAVLQKPPTKLFLWLPVL
jgi:hypothetical protein